MVVLLWDASALAKRYALEVGSDAVDALFAVVADQRFLRAAQAEDLPVLDPKPFAAADIPSLLAVLRSSP